MVIASNRVIDPKKPAAGGLAVALGDMMYNTNGLWFGCSNDTTDEPDSKSVQTEPFGGTTLAKVDLSKQQHENYYAGFSNSVLWPVFHQTVELADLNPVYFKSYEQVNKMLAAKLVPMVKDNDILWIHDYHLILLAKELRAQGCQQPIGFFNHIPLPPPDVIKQIPQHKQLMEALFSYDVVGMQSSNDVENLRRYVEMEGVGKQLDGSLMDAFGKQAIVRNFPIGIDVKKFRALESSPCNEVTQKILDKVRNESGKRMLMIGVDRLDYSKGIPERLKAFRELLETSPELRNKVTLVQIAAPTRESVPAYAALIKKVQKLVDKINGKFKTDTWEPILYFNEPAERNALPEIYRRSRVGLVTPVADGMNLVAKEYVAAQAPEDPGVLVLSTGAGAASQLREALLVPPKDRTAIAKAQRRALTMPLAERQKRHAPNMKNVETKDLSWWQTSCLEVLSSVRSSSTSGGQRVTGEASSSNPKDVASSQALSAPEGEQSTFNSGETGSFDASRLESARKVYEENRFYHGTGGREKREVQAYGFRRTHRVDGGSAAARAGWNTESQGENEPSYNYFTKEKNKAARYALAAKSGSPSIVRTIGMHHDLPFERVMGVDRTSSDIPAQYIVGSKSSDPGPESAVFQKALKRTNIDVSLQEAGQLLRQVQSDSENDFSSDDNSDDDHE